MKEELHSYCGTGVKMEGVLRFRGALRYDGIFKGEILSPDSLIVGKDGRLEANINVGSFFNMGEVTGEINASKKIAIHLGSRLTGDIHTPALVSEEGALFTGKCVMPAVITTDTKAKKGAEKDVPKEILSDTALTDNVFDEKTGSFTVNPNGKTGKGRFFAVTLGLLIVVAAVGYYFFTPKTSMGVSFLSHWMYERAAQDNPARLHAIADVYFTEGSFAQAARVYKRIKEIAPTDPIVAERLAVSLEKSGSMDEASQLYEEALNASPHDKSLQEKLVTFYKSSGNLEKLMLLYEKMIEREPENSSVAKTLFKYYSDSKNNEKALALYKSKIASSPMTAENLATVGALEKQLGKIDDAIKTYTQIVANNPSDKGSILTLAYLHHKLGGEEKALELFTKLAKLDPTHPEADVNNGMAEMAKGKLLPAMEIFNGVLTRSPENPRALLALATAHSRLGDNVKAEKYCRQVLLADADYAPAQNKIARIYMQQKINLDQAEQYSLASLKHEGATLDYNDTLSEIYFLKKDYEKAIGALDVALKQRPYVPRYKDQMRKFIEAKKETQPK
ncbi:MAG: tetratricopeptide repeat protein [Nitrospinae bacterium]|nr:tetratricopeptide repeat protein [Nitrospinota bacterium]